MSKLGTGCFALLTMLSLAWICVGAVFTSSVAGSVALTPAPRSTLVSAADAKAISTMAAGITGGLGLGFFACTGLTSAVICAVLTLVCYFNWQDERRHRERLQADHARNDVLANMALAQLAQAQIQNTDLQGKKKRDFEPPHYWEPK